MAEVQTAVHRKTRVQRADFHVINPCAASVTRSLNAIPCTRNPDAAQSEPWIVREIDDGRILHAGTSDTGRATVC